MFLFVVVILVVAFVLGPAGWVAAVVGVLVIMLIRFVVGVLSHRMTIYARRMAAQSRNVVAESPLNDDRPDVLYLRCFSADALKSTLTPVLTTEEEDLKRAVRPLGDLVAIGQPGESLPPLGAARHYCARDENWQNSVCERMRVAPLVIIRAGYGDGLLWECEQAFRMLAPSQIVILVLDIRATEYKRFAAAMHSRLGIVLPAIPGFSVLGSLRDYKSGPSKVTPGFIVFSEGWHGQFVRIRLGVFKLPVRLLVKPFRNALGPVFAAHRVSGR